MQYRSLVELDNKTKVAFKDNLRQGFAILQRQMKQRLESVAGQILDPIGHLNPSPAGAAQQIENHFANVKRSHPEIEAIFAYWNGKPEQNSYAYFYSDRFAKFAQAEFTPAQTHILSLYLTDRGRPKVFSTAITTIHSHMIPVRPVRRTCASEHICFIR